MPSDTSPATRPPRRAKPKSAKAAKPASSRRSEVISPVIDPEHRRDLIAKVAYFRAERRNFATGFEEEDWMAAEAEVDTTLTMGVTPSDN
jgi:Protein of unknown function (DUF2934)